jgi:hypothetical protein
LFIFSLVFASFVRMQRFLFLGALLTLSLFLSCGEKKECPGFSSNLDPYIPREDRLVFRNAAGDSLVFNTPLYKRQGPHTEKQNVLSVGGSGSKPYCRCAASLGSVYNEPPEPQELGYSIKIDNEALTCSLSVDLTSGLPSKDYFLQTAAYSSEGRLFGDTLKLGTYTTTTAPRFSRIEIVHGRGIIRIQDDVKGCLWFR